MTDHTTGQGAQLRALIAAGLTLHDCLTAFAVADPETDPYVQAADNLYGYRDGVEIVSPAVISEADDGAWVLAWLWASVEEETGEEGA